MMLAMIVFVAKVVEDVRRKGDLWLVVRCFVSAGFVG